jgi:hypothetical protein
VNTLLNNATNANGYYGFFGTHDDYRDTTFSDSIVNASKAFNVPVISAKQALNWLDGRNNSSFSAFSWNGNTLNFTVTTGTGSQGIQAMLPAVSSTNTALNTLKLNGSPVTFTLKTIKGINYAFFPASNGAYVATYSGTPPTPTPTQTNQIVSLWNNLIIPNTPDASDTNAIEVGLKFTADVAGQVTGMKFYKGPTNTGTHTGHLWSSTGTLLATATFSGETASGWQQVSFNTPVPVTANTTYIISYYAPVGQYAADANYFTVSYDNAPLHAPATGTSGGNGVYVYGPLGSFPTSTFNANNYWVDVIYQTGSGPTATPTPPAATPTPTAGPTATPTPPAATPTPAPVASIWNNTTSPAVADANDNSAVELGVKFTSDVPGQITGLKFYKGTTNTGTHIGHLWTSTGTLLATATFSGETASGWQQVTFGTPVTIAAGTTYIASYYAPVGQYAADSNYFATAFDNAPLHAPATGTSGGNGVYAYGAVGLFPSNTFNATNYWIDVLFQAGAAPTPTAPPATPTPTAGPSATPTPTPVTTTSTIWASSVVPANPQENDPSAVSLGVKFTSDVAGQITGIRFYKASGNTGVHTGSLWSSAGTRLATVTFSGETASGWQQALFSTPVTITPGTTYIASYFAPNGNYAGDNNYFASAFNNAPLHALASGTSGGNGVYIYGSDAFPVSTYNASNYWVDVVFQH